MQVRKHIQVSVVKNVAYGSLYFGSYTLWKIGFVASPETSQNQVFRVQRHNFFIKDQNLVRKNVLVRVQSVVLCVTVSDHFMKYFVRGTLYKVAL
jgi:hypothetical protein